MVKEWLRKISTVLLRPAHRVISSQVERLVQAELRRLREEYSAGYRPIERLASGLSFGTVPSQTLFGSSLCRMEDMVHPAYAQICQKWLLEPPGLHRKQWEYAYIIEKLRSTGCLQQGRRGLGFGVGREPLPSVFVSQGCVILATDAPTRNVDDEWKHTGQHSDNAISLWNPRLVSRDLFLERCQFQSLDMNSHQAIPAGYDFHWSSCVIEHLGGIRQAIDFVINSVHRLAPGGVAVHTTELNLSSNSDTLDAPQTCILRGRDIEELAGSLTSLGFMVEPIVLDMGLHPYNFHVDPPPYGGPIHLRLLIGNYAATSIGLVIRKPSQ